MDGNAANSRKGKGMKRVLFICTHNSSRSQMAEGLINHALAGRFEAHSAGTEPSFVNPLAIVVMNELGIDISRHRSKGLDEFDGQNFDYVITLCSQADAACPFFFRRDEDNSHGIRRSDGNNRR